MKNIQTTVTGIINVFCPRCSRKQLAIHPNSGYQIMNGQMPICQVCSGSPRIITKTTVGKMKKVKGKKVKQKNRKKYKLRRTLKS